MCRSVVIYTKTDSALNDRCRIRDWNLFQKSVTLRQTLDTEDNFEILLSDTRLKTNEDKFSISFNTFENMILSKSFSEKITFLMNSVNSVIWHRHNDDISTDTKKSKRFFLFFKKSESTLHMRTGASCDSQKSRTKYFSSFGLLFCVFVEEIRCRTCQEIYFFTLRTVFS